MRITIIALIAAILFTACSSSEIGNSGDVNPQTIFIHYSLSYNEGDEQVAAQAQFRFAGENGTTLVLNDPASVTLDGQPMLPDSSLFNGAYYTAHLPFNSFAGAHSFVFTGSDKKIYTEDVVFTPFTIAPGFEHNASKKQALFIPVNGLKDNDSLLVSISDTTQNGNDADMLLPVMNGGITINSTTLEAFAAGPLYIDIRKHALRSLNDPTRQGGTIETSYRLQTVTVDLHKE